MVDRGGGLAFDDRTTSYRFREEATVDARAEES